jgi:hypothetical protein
VITLTAGGRSGRAQRKKRKEIVPYDSLMGDYTDSGRAERAQRTERKEIRSDIFALRPLENDATM